MSVSNSNQEQFVIYKDKDWFQTAESGDKTTYDQNTLDTHVTIQQP